MTTRFSCKKGVKKNDYNSMGLQTQGRANNQTRCKENAKWLKNLTRSPDFETVKLASYENRGGITSAPRPSAKEDTTTVAPKAGAIPTVHRTTLNDIVRPSYKLPKIQGRELVDFDKLRVADIEKHGIKVQFGEKSAQALSDALSLPEKFKKLGEIIKIGQNATNEDMDELSLILESIVKAVDDGTLDVTTLAQQQIKLLQESVRLLSVSAFDEPEEEVKAPPQPGGKAVWNINELKPPAGSSLAERGEVAANASMIKQWLTNPAVIAEFNGRLPAGVAKLSVSKPIYGKTGQPRGWANFPKNLPKGSVLDLDVRQYRPARP